jgi:hypothetical protein
MAVAPFFLWPLRPVLLFMAVALSLSLFLWPLSRPIAAIKKKNATRYQSTGYKKEERDPISIHRL